MSYFHFMTGSLADNILLSDLLFCFPPDYIKRTKFSNIFICRVLTPVYSFQKIIELNFIFYSPLKRDMFILYSNLFSKHVNSIKAEIFI